MLLLIAIFMSIIAHAHTLTNFSAIQASVSGVQRTLQKYTPSTQLYLVARLLTHTPWLALTDAL